MAFMGGAECSTGANPLSQFSKHVQDDKSLQRDRMVGRGPGGLQEGMRRTMHMGGSDGMMDEFMQQSAMPHASAAPLSVEQMQRQFESLNTGPQVRNGSPQNWAGEFDPGMDHPHMEAAFRPQKQGGFDPREFERYVQSRTSPQAMNASPATLNGYQRPMGMGYGGMYGGMGMGSMMGGQYQQYNSMQQPQQEVTGKGKERMVELDDRDWEAQFAKLDEALEAEGRDMDAEAQARMEAELDELDRSVHPNFQKLDAMKFEKVWEKIKAELPRSMFDSATDEDRFRAHTGELADEWENFDSHGFSSHFRDPQLGQYMFEEENIFKNVNNPFEEGVRIMDSGGNLSLAALAFEAAVQKEPNHVEAWTRLGAAQAQNEKETPAIRALEQAMKLDPTNLDALMGLAVSYTNEGYDSTAYRTLERWLSIKYPDVIPADVRKANEDATIDPFSADITFTDRETLHKRVTDYFILAAQKAPSPELMDPDVQVGLGVLFYGAEEYDKAVDCFSAALASSEEGLSNRDTANQRPLLWNRLGATLANSGRSEEAIDAYEKALELNPNFVRARYNLGVSCINVGCYSEAAQHLLGALAMHAVVEKEGKEKAREIAGVGPGGSGMRENDFDSLIKQNQSTNLYDTLRRVFGQMGRRDLADKVVNGVDVDIFRGEFDF